MLTAMRAHTSGSQASYEASFRLRSNGSGYRLLHSRGRVFECSADGRASRLVGTTIDLTPRPCTPRAGLPDGPRGAVAGRSADLPFHRLLAMQRAGATTGSAAERKRLLLLVEDLVRATLAQLEAQRLPTP